MLRTLDIYTQSYVLKIDLDVVAPNYSTKTEKAGREGSLGALSSLGTGREAV